MTINSPSNTNHHTRNEAIENSIDASADFCNVKGLLPFEEALQILLSNITPLEKTQLNSIEQAVNYVLAENIISPISVPPHHNSAMDGYAYAANSLNYTDTLTMVGRAMAGQPYHGECGEGECIRIMTGAKLPDSCNAVEMQEKCEANDMAIRFEIKRKAGANIRYAGEDIQQNELVLPRGKRLSVADIGLLASLGIDKVSVYTPVKVALIATGDELKLPGQALTEGDIYESNRFVLRPLLEKLNVEVIDFGIIRDDYQAIKNAFQQANQQADIVISSGGVSVGEADYTKDVLAELGEIGFWKLAMKPGKPFAFGKLTRSVFFGLPGNPVSALVTMYQLAVPGIVKMQNAAPLIRTKIKVKAATNIRKSPGRKDFQRGILAPNEHGELVVTLTGAQGSGILSSIAKANCFIVLAAAAGAVEAGEMVDVELFDSLLCH